MSELEVVEGLGTVAFGSQSMTVLSELPMQDDRSTAVLELYIATLRHQINELETREHLKPAQARPVKRASTRANRRFLTSADMREISARRARGEKLASIAHDFRVTVGAISQRLGRIKKCKK